MAGRLDGKVAIVTGGSRGIGRAISSALAGQGAAVVLAARSVDALAEAADLVRQKGGRAEPVVTELAEEQSIRNLVRGTNVRVHGICPGAVDTGMAGNARLDIKKEELIGPNEIAELALYLVTHRGNAVINELHLRRAAASWFG
jgi:NADP-dependent 3-hydroxy acid dehydrogenase YdfG